MYFRSRRESSTIDLRSFGMATMEDRLQSGSTAPLMFRETLTVHSASRPFAFHRFHARSIAAPPTFPNFPLGSNPFRDPLFDMVARKRTFVTGTETLGVHHQSEMFIIRHVARARTHTHIHRTTRARAHIHVRAEISYSRQITGHASS